MSTHRTVHLLVLASVFSLGLLGASFGTAAVAAASADLPAIQLRSRTITPGADPLADRALMESMLDEIARERLGSSERASSFGAPPVPAGDGTHLLIQFAELPDSAERAALANAGIELQGYLPENAFIARVRDGAEIEGVTDLLALGVTWLGPITGTDKLSPSIARASQGGGAAGAPVGAVDSAALPAHASVGDGRIAIYVEFHRDVRLDVGIAAAAGSSGAVVAGRVDALNGAVLLVEPSALDKLASLDEVKWIEVASPALGELNDGVREQIGVDAIQEAPLSIQGEGITVLVYDGGLVCATQPDLSPRVIAGENGFDSSHATHVAGTLGGNGSSSDGQYRGMAPGVDIVSYGYESCDPMCLYNNPQDLVDDYAEGIAQHGAAFATNSIGANISANGYDCDLLGDYENTSRLIDAIARGALGTPFLSIWAAGNERGGFAPCGNLYNTTGVPGTAKNNIVVGATNSDDLTIADFSSLGPVDDGRMRPDLVAPGCQRTGDSGVTSLRACSGHTVLCGTSMATPAVAGVVALVTQRLGDSPRGPVSLPSTMKAILACSAVDLGNAGPDYTFGYGQVDATEAIAVVDGGIVLESQISHQETLVRTFMVSTANIRIRAVLAWDDEPGEPLSIRNLVNDLDLRLVDPNGGVHHPFVLNPYRPGDTAVRGFNRRDPSEMIEVENAPAGIWRIEVDGLSVPSGPQSLAVVVHAPEAGPIAVADGGEVIAAPSEGRLAQNVPNPFNPSTTIRFEAGGEWLQLRIYDLRGRLIRTLIDSRVVPGSHRVAWDGRDDAGRRVVSGVYVYALIEGARSERRRMVLVR